MKLKTLLLTLSLILAGFTHSVFGFYGVDLGKLKVIEDSSKNQDSDYNDVQYKVNPTVLWQNINSAPVGGSGGIFYNQPRVTNPFWKNTNTIDPNPFGGIFNTINSNIPDKDNNDLGIRYQRDKYGNKINIKSNSPSPYIDERDISRNTKATEGIKLEFFNGEWREYQEVKSNHTKEDAKGQSESDAIAKRKEKERQRAENERIAAERIRQAESDKIAKQKELDKQRAEEEYQARIAQEESLSEIDKDDKNDSESDININNLVTDLMLTGDRLTGSLLNAAPVTIYEENVWIPALWGDPEPPAWSGQLTGGTDPGSADRGGSSSGSAGKAGSSQSPINPNRTNRDSGLVNPTRETGGATNTQSGNSGSSGKADKIKGLDPLIKFVDENHRREFNENVNLLDTQGGYYKGGYYSGPEKLPTNPGLTPEELPKSPNAEIEDFFPNIQHPSTTPGNEKSPLKTNQLDQLTNDDEPEPTQEEADAATDSIGLTDDRTEEQKKKDDEFQKKRKREEEEARIRAAEMARDRERVERNVEARKARRSGERGESGAIAGHDGANIWGASTSDSQGNGSDDSDTGGGNHWDGLWGTPPSGNGQGNGSDDSGSQGNGSDDSGNGQGNGTPPSGTGQGNGSDPNSLGLGDSSGGSTSSTGGNNRSSSSSDSNSGEGNSGGNNEGDNNTNTAEVGLARVQELRSAWTALGIIDLNGQWTDLSIDDGLIYRLQKLAKRFDTGKVNIQEHARESGKLLDWQDRYYKLGVTDMLGYYTESSEDINRREVQKISIFRDLGRVSDQEWIKRVKQEMDEEAQIESARSKGLSREIYIKFKKIQYEYGSARLKRINTEIQRRMKVELARGTDPNEFVLTEKKINAVIASINRNTSQEQSERERLHSPSVRGDWSQGSYEERQIAKLYKKKKTNKKSSSDDKSDNDSDD